MKYFQKYMNISMHTLLGNQVTHKNEKHLHSLVLNTEFWELVVA